MPFAPCDFSRLFLDEDAARAWFEHARWPDGPTCYHCGTIGDAAYMPKTKFWHGKACKKKFSVTAGTPMHRTHLSLLTWAQAIYLIVASNKGTSVRRLGELLDVSYETAWHLGHRVRAMIVEGNPLLSNL